MGVVDKIGRTRSKKIKSGDTYVRLSCDKSLELEDRTYLLSYAFAKIVQGAILKEIISWGIKDGCIEFVVGGGAAIPGPRGLVCAELEDWPVHADLKEVKLELVREKMEKSE